MATSCAGSRRVEKVRILVNDQAAEQTRARSADQMRREFERSRVLPPSHQSKLDSRLLPHLRARLQTPRDHHQLDLQRLGQVRQLARRQPDSRVHREADEHPSSRTRDRAGRRQHRCQRRRSSAHHRGVPAQPGHAGSESGFQARGLGALFCKISWNRASDLAEERHRRRRHPRPHRRPSSLRQSKHGRHRRRNGSLRSQPRTPARKPGYPQAHRPADRAAPHARPSLVRRPAAAR